MTLVCAPALLAPPRRLRTLKDLTEHTLLHLDTAHGILDWDTWLTAEGLGGLKGAASLRFDNYEQLIQAARMGQGVGLGIKRLVDHLIAQGELVVPFGEAVASQRSYYVLRAPSARTQPHIDAFVAWLKSEADACLTHDAPAATPPAPARISSRPRAGRSSGARRPAR